MYVYGIILPMIISEVSAVLKKHIHYFDYLRIIAAISVVYMHIAAIPLRSTLNTNWHIINLFTSFAFTAVPLFFMMSGYLVLSDERTLDIKLLFKKRLPHLIVPLIAYTVIAIFWKLCRADDFSLSSFYTALISSLSQPAWVHFWYMYTLIALYCISPIICAALSKLDKNGHIFIICIIALISLRSALQAILPDSLDALLNLDIINKLTFFGGHLGTFILGYYLGRLERKIPMPLLILCACITLAVITFGTYHLTRQTGGYNQAFQNQSAGFEILLASCIFLIFKQSCDYECRILKYVPVIPLSLAIYLMHNIVISVLEHYKYITEIVTFFDTALITAIIFAISYFIAKTLASLPLLCFPITGLTFRSACSSCNWIYTFKNIFSKNTTSQ